MSGPVNELAPQMVMESGGGGGSSGEVDIPIKPEPVVMQRLDELRSTVKALEAVVDNLEGVLCRSLKDADPKPEKQETGPDAPIECHIAMRIRDERDLVDVQANKILDLISRLEV